MKCCEHVHRTCQMFKKFCVWLQEGEERDGNRKWSINDSENDVQY